MYLLSLIYFSYQVKTYCSDANETIYFSLRSHTFLDIRTIIGTAEIDRDHEAFECAHQAATNQPDDARDEHGDDKSRSSSYLQKLFANDSQAGIMEEMLEDVLEMDEDEELEEEADAEVEQVLFDITDGKLGAAGSVKTDLPVSKMTILL